MPRELQWVALLRDALLPRLVMQPIHAPLHKTPPQPLAHRLPVQASLAATPVF